LHYIFLKYVIVALEQRRKERKKERQKEKEDLITKEYNK
jgi:hypothetical protein